MLCISLNVSSFLLCRLCLAWRTLSNPIPENWLLLIILLSVRRSVPLRGFPWSPKKCFGNFFRLCIEESKLLHFVNRKTPFCKVPGKEPLEIPWPHPTTHEPIGPQTRISWLNVQELVVYLGNRDQSKTNTQPFERKWPIRCPPTYKFFFSWTLPI